MEVLKLIGSGLTNDDIASRLVISRATVKRHISNVYGKLDVPGRTQAILRARELHLID
jgi:ATP/maltotriose-dependent transcriptional regulator MalT